MAAPRGTLDERYSDPGATAAAWEAVLRTLREAELFWLTTIGSAGRPHATPVVAVWEGDTLSFCTGPGEQKAAHLRARPRVLLLVGDGDWEGGMDVSVEGTAVATTGRGDLERLAGAWRTKWDGRWRFEVGDGCFLHPAGAGKALVFSVVPTVVRAFTKGTFSQTRFELGAAPPEGRHAARGMAPSR